MIIRSEDVERNHSDRFSGSVLGFLLEEMEKIR
jgi:hypothetical protein